MDSSDFGYSKRGVHSRILTHAESVFLALLWEDHVGRENKISAPKLAILYGSAMGDHPFGKISIWKRNVRYMQNHLLFDHTNVPVYSKAGHEGGYWISDDDNDADEFFNSFRKRGMTGLLKATRGKKSQMVKAMKQLSFEFEDLLDQTGITVPDSETGAAMPVEVVDSFLGKMLQDPEKYADGLKKIGLKYGSILLPRIRMEAIREQAARLQELTAGLGG